MKTGERHREGGHVMGNLVLAPFIGLAYVIALPFIAIGTVLAVAGKKAVTGAANLAGNLASFGWRPLEAYLSGKKKLKGKKDKS